MPKREAIDRPTRLRIAAYLRREWRKFQRTVDSPTQRDFADRLQLHEGTVSNILTGKTEAGFDVALALNRKLRVEAEYLLNEDPPAEFFQPIKGRHGGARKKKPLPLSNGSGYPQSAAPPSYAPS